MFLGRQCYYLSLTYGMHVSSLINHFPYHVLAEVWHNPSLPLSRLVLFGYMEENLHPTDLPNSTGTYLYMPVSELVRIALNSQREAFHLMFEASQRCYLSFTALYLLLFTCTYW